ncbi:MAG: zinc ribbon domain-containing protein [Clostridia bacterium]|nr:zinc ribbon domain-containing protein [Clostridia bacterium]MBR6701855.1 zinc ribbon domain-containing protein [Clostridia bacterium]
MSYCVKCGVELDDSAKKCPLCDTSVYMPNADASEQDTPAPFSREKAIPKDAKKEFAASVITVLLAIPMIVCGIVNLFYRRDGFWSAYVITSVMLFWIIVILPFYLKKIRPYLMWFIDTAAVLAYVYVFFPLRNENDDYYLTVALPIISAVSLCILFFIIWARGKERHWSAILIHIALDIALISAVTGIISIYYSVAWGMIASLIVFLSVLSLMGFGIYCNRSKKVRAWLEKKFFI